MMDYQDWHGGAGEWLAMGVMMLLFWGVAIAVLMWAIRGTHSSPSFRGASTEPPAPRPEDVLACRYANGEIDEEEFARRRDVLRSGASR